MRARIVVLFIALTGLWAMMFARAAFLQIWPNERLKSLQKKQFETVVTLRPRRGDVLDRKGHELAVSMTAYSLFADPKLIENPKKTARLLAKELNQSAGAILQKINNKKKRFVWLQRHLEKPKQEAIERLKIKGLGFIEEAKRIYPNERLLSHVLGFVGGEGKGLEGLEARYNDTLEGANKKFSFQRDARGRPLIINGQIFTESPDGSDVHLTIDRELQYILEQELRDAVARHRADAAVGVVLDAQTSEILAMGNAPTFDPNAPSSYGADARRNRAVTDAFEPGSTMKTFAIAGALSRGLIEPNTKFDTEGGQMRIGKRVIREADAHHRFDTLSVSEILAYSSNVGSAKIGFKLGDKELRAWLEKFGFGERAGVDLPGEAKGILQPLPWRDHLLSNISFGHGMSATPLQIANAYAAIANGGWLKRPYVVKRVRDAESGETVETQPKTLRQVLLPEHASKLKLMLMGTTVKEGTGWNARVPGFPVAGKTGTAQKVDPNGRGYMDKAYISSFAGFLPANDPRFVIYIAIDNPREGYYGSQVAAPIFSRVAGFAVRQAGLAPVLISEQNLLPRNNLSDAARELARSAADAKAAAAQGRAAEVGALALASEKKKAEDGFGPASQMAGHRAGASAIAESVNVDAGRSEREALAVGGGFIVPELTGLTLREVLGRISGSGVELNIQGRGFVARTVPEAGARLEDKKHLTVILAPIRE